MDRARFQIDKRSGLIPPTGCQTKGERPSQVGVKNNRTDCSRLFSCAICLLLSSNTLLSLPHMQPHSPQQHNSTQTMIIPSLIFLAVALSFLSLVATSPIVSASHGTCTYLSLTPLATALLFSHVAMHELAILFSI